MTSPATTSTPDGRSRLQIRHPGAAAFVAATWLGAFSLSYDHARQITGPESWTGYVWPLVLDVAVMAGTAVLMAARRTTDKRAWLALLGLALMLPGLGLSAWANYLAGSSTFLIVASCLLPWFVLVGAEVLSVLGRSERASDADPASVALLVTLTATENAGLAELVRRLDAHAAALDGIADRLTEQAARAQFLAAELAVRLAVPSREQVLADLTKQAREDARTAALNGATKQTATVATKRPATNATKQTATNATKRKTDDEVIALIAAHLADHPDATDSNVARAVGVNMTRVAKLRKPTLHAVGGAL